MHLPSLLLLAALAPARAAPPLVLVADVAEEGLRAWWRAGELVVGKPAEPGRPGLRPLSSLLPAVLPDDLDRWAEVGEDCVPHPESQADLEGQRVTARVLATSEGPLIQLVVGETLLAENAIGRPVRICEVLLAEADALPGLEVIVAWRMERAPGPGELRGLTVYRVPETAR